MTIQSMDYLFLEKFLDIAVREHPGGWGFGNFYAVQDGKAGNKVVLSNGAAAARKLLETGRSPLHRGHGLWTNHTYNSARDDKLIAKGFNKARDFKQLFPNVELQYSFICEHALRGGSLRKVIEPLIRQADGTGVRIVNSFSDAGDFFNDPRVVNETHGDTHQALRGQYNFSWDGQTAFDGHVEKIKARHAAALAFFWWIAAFNGKFNDADSTLIAQRRAYPMGQDGSNLIDSVIYLARDVGGDVWLPSTDRNGIPLAGVPIKKQWIMKTHADQHSVPAEQRAHKLLFIIPPKQRVELVADNGQIVAVSGAPQSFNDGRWRVYFDDWGYLIAEKAMRINKRPILKVRVDGTIVGEVNTSQRCGAAH